MTPASASPLPPPAGPSRSRLRIFARQMALGVLVVTTLGSVWGTAWVVTSVADDRPDDVTPVRDSLAFLRSGLEHGSADAAQQQFPEGHFFSYVLYGLAWTDLAAAGEADQTVARRHARWALDHLDSSAGRAVFDERLTPAFGIFYAGWTLLLRAQAAELSSSTLPTAERERLAGDAQAVAAAFAADLDAGGSPFLMAYPGQSWPVDSVVAIAALRRADRVTAADHGPLLDRWLRRSNELLDPTTGLLPHRTDPTTGRAVEGSRGTSQSIIQRMWPIVDPSSAGDTYRRFRDQFVASAAGFVGVREHPIGSDGGGDVDSGPLVLGFSASATAVSVGAARVNGDDELAVTLLHEADVFGAPLTIGGERRYAFGAMPIGDAFLTWARAAPRAEGRPQSVVSARWPFVLLVPWLALALTWGWCVRSRRCRGGHPTRKAGGVGPSCGGGSPSSKGSGGGSGAALGARRMFGHRRS